MRGYLFFTSLVILYSVPLVAQNSDSIAIKKYYEENAILWLGSTKYFKNNQSFPLKNLKEEIKFSRDAIYEFSRYRRNRTYLNVGFTLGVALFASAIAVQDREAKLGLLAGSMAVLTFTLPFSFSTSNHLSRSIWLHNRDILLR